MPDDEGVSEVVEGQDYSWITEAVEHALAEPAPDTLSLDWTRQGWDTGVINGFTTVVLPDEGEDEEIPPETVEDDPWDTIIDHEALEKAYKATQPPGGYYEVQKLEGTTSTRETEFYIQAHDGFAKVRRNRRATRYSGMGTREVEGKTWRSRLSFNVSPVCAYGKNEDGSVNPDKFDSAHKLYCRAYFAYEQVLGEKPLKPRDIDTYLKTYPLKLRTMQTSDGLIVLDIQGVKPA